MKLYFFLVCVATCILTRSGMGAEEYDPLKPSVAGEVRVIDLTVSDKGRKRDIPIRVYLPPQEASGAETKAQPLVLFSHGLGGSRSGSPFLGKHWAARGYVSVFLQHPGSDEAVWKDQPLLQRMAAMREAASLENFRLRNKDVSSVLDQLALWNEESGHELQGKCLPKIVGMSGHSFGGQTTQAVSGQKFPIIGQGLTDSRIKAAIVMSPSAPDRGDIGDAFGSVKIPWLLMTGTHDTAAVGNQTPESRRRVYPAVAPGEKFELVLDQAEHSAFTDRPLPGETKKRNPNHHRVILALSTAFWDAYLRGDEGAKTWLKGEAPRQILEKEDIWRSGFR